jgi:polysaccharide pyruvyl transferase WcaK-like protein
VDDAEAPGAPRKWPPGQPRILATDAWLANAGDAAIALALERMLCELAPTGAVLHAAYQHDRIGPLLPELICVPPLEDLLGTPWAPPAPGWETAGSALVDAADLVVCQGGGFLVEAYEPWARLATLAEVVRRGKPLAFVGVTVDRFTRAPSRADLHTMFTRAQLTVVRDPPSAVFAADCGAADVVLGTDLALAMFADRPGERDRQGVGVVLTDHHADPARRSQLEEVAKSVLRVVIEHAAGRPVTVWSTVQGERDVAREDDGEIARRAVAALSDSQRDAVKIETGYVPPARAIELAGTCEALVSMRMHPALFAAGAGTPYALVLGGQRTGVFSGSTLADRIVAPRDAGGVAAAVRAVLAEPAPAATWDALAPLRSRLDDTRSRLGELVERVATHD